MRIPRFVLDPYIRRRVNIAATPLDRFTVRVAKTVAEHEAAYRLLSVAYAFQGIRPMSGAMDLRITRHHVLPEATVLVAYEGDLLVGTMTVTCDSPAGLPLEHDYPEQLKALRKGGARLVEYGSLAVVRRCWHSGVTTLLAMAAHWMALKIHRASHCVMGINPKAGPVYRAIYAFDPLGAAQDHAELHAPVQGMVQDFDRALIHFQRVHRKPMQTGLLPHEHFVEHLPPCVEMLPARSLRELARVKLPRTVFRRLFVEGHNHVETLDEQTRSHLSSYRSVKTIQATVPALSG